MLEPRLAAPPTELVRLEACLHPLVLQRWFHVQKVWRVSAQESRLRPVPRLPQQRLLRTVSWTVSYPLLHLSIVLPDDEIIGRIYSKDVTTVDKCRRADTTQVASARGQHERP